MLRNILLKKKLSKIDDESVITYLDGEIPHELVNTTLESEKNKKEFEKKYGGTLKVEKKYNHWELYWFNDEVMALFVYDKDLQRGTYRLVRLLLTDAMPVTKK